MTSGLVILSSTFLRVVVVSLGEVLPFEELRAFRYRFVYRLGKGHSGLMFAKKLFADKKHSYTEPVAGYVLVVSDTWADFLAILNGIATQGHSGTVSISMIDLVICQPLLDLQHHFWLWKELVRSPGGVPFREALCPL